MTPTTKAAVIEALESCDPGDWSTGHVIHPSYDEDKVNAALALLYAEPEPTPEPGEREAWTNEGVDDLCWSAFETAMASGVSVDSFRWLANSLRAKQLPPRAARASLPPAPTPKKTT